MTRGISDSSEQAVVRLVRYLFGGVVELSSCRTNSGYTNQEIQNDDGKTG